MDVQVYTCSIQYFSLKDNFLIKSKMDKNTLETNKALF